MLDEAVKTAVHNAALALADASVTLEPRIR
jgi:hypothetical protein